VVVLLLFPILLSFVTGDFTPEGAEKGVIANLTPEQISQLETWRDFYAKEEKYPFIGVLEGELYDRNGKPTEEMQRVESAIAEGKKKMEERQRKQKELVERRKREAAEKKAKEEQDEL